MGKTPVGTEIDGKDVRGAADSVDLSDAGNVVSFDASVEVTKQDGTPSSSQASSSSSAIQDHAIATELNAIRTVVDTKATPLGAFLAVLAGLGVAVVGFGFYFTSTFSRIDADFATVNQNIAGVSGKLEAIEATANSIDGKVTVVADGLTDIESDARALESMYALLTAEKVDLFNIGIALPKDLQVAIRQNDISKEFYTSRLNLSRYMFLSGKSFSKLTSLEQELLQTTVEQKQWNFEVKDVLASSPFMRLDQESEKLFCRSTPSREDFAAYLVSNGLDADAVFDATTASLFSLSNQLCR